MLPAAVLDFISSLIKFFDFIKTPECLKYLSINYQILLQNCYFCIYYHVLCFTSVYRQFSAYFSFFNL